MLLLSPTMSAAAHMVTELKSTKNPSCNVECRLKGVQFLVSIYAQEIMVVACAKEILEDLFLLLKTEGGYKYLTIFDFILGSGILKIYY